MKVSGEKSAVFSISQNQSQERLSREIKKQNCKIIENPSIIRNGISANICETILA